MVIARGPHIVTVLRAVAAAGALTAFYGIAQYFGWDPLLPAAAYHIGEGVWTIVRPPSTLGYVSYFATWLLFVIFPDLALAAQETGATARRSVQCCAAPSLCNGADRSARRALGAAAGAACVCAGAACSSVLSNQSARAAVGLTVVWPCCGAGAAFYHSSPGGQLRSRARWFAERIPGGARPKLWRDSLLMGVARPLAGYGPETFTAEFPRWESVDLAQAYPDFAHESPHNIFSTRWLGPGRSRTSAVGRLLRRRLCRRLAAPRQTQEHRGLPGCRARRRNRQPAVHGFTIPTAVIFIQQSHSPSASRANPPPRNNGTRSARPARYRPLRRCPRTAPPRRRYAIADRSLGLAKRSLNRAMRGRRRPLC
jgi:hypothetical protein